MSDLKSNMKKEQILDSDVKDYIQALLEKSEEAYLMSLEIINKPTLKYRTEGFCFFICNAWELVLKAFIIRRENSISAMNFKNNQNQTLGLSECIERVFTSTTDYTKTNLNMVRSIRNKATHNVLPDYDFIFAPLFQKCINNLLKFYEKHFPEYKVNKSITPFVALSNAPDTINSPLVLNPTSLMQFKSLETELNNDISGDITQTIKLVSTKKSNEADLVYALEPNSEKAVHFINVPKDVNVTHPFLATEAVKSIKESLMLSLGSDFGFNMHKFTAFCKDKGIKENQNYCYKIEAGKEVRYKYSHDLINYAVYILSEENGAKKINPGQDDCSAGNPTLLA